MHLKYLLNTETSKRIEAVNIRSVVYFQVIVHSLDQT